MSHSIPTLLLSMGTRPEIIKMMPIYLELKQRGMKPLLVHTGQHGEMAQSLYGMFDIVPDYVIDLKREAPNTGSDNHHACDLAELGSKLLLECSAVLTKANPSMVLVHGDTSSALMMALAAYYHKCKIAHIEAGLRSHDEYHPFPEEKNRVLIGQIAGWHFAPSLRARNNLVAEGVHDRAIHVVGNTVIQAVKLGGNLFEQSRRDASPAVTHVINTLQKLQGKRLILVTTHRRENQKNGIHEIAAAVIQLLHKHEDTVVVWPMHPNPKVMAIINHEIGSFREKFADRLLLTEPLSYPILLWILQQAWIVLTDSGGIQEEASALNTPFLVLRKNTERLELIEAGAGMLVGTDSERIISVVTALANNPQQYAAMKNIPNPYGDASVANSICNILLGVDHG